MHPFDDDLNKLLHPTWGAEKWILQGWNLITGAEKKSIQARVEKLFQNGLPFEFNQDKLLYLYLFSSMVQLEIISLQIPIQYQDAVPAHLKPRLHAQLVDELCHAIVFTKIVFALAAPHQWPPRFNEQIETLCEFIRNQECMKMGLVLMNLIIKNLIEEVYSILHQYQIAPQVFQLILEDEHRHVIEAELYCELGLPSEDDLKDKLQILEKLILSACPNEPQYAMACSALLGPEGALEFLNKVHEKYTQLVKKVHFQPSDHWELGIYLAKEFKHAYEPQSKLQQEVLAEIFEVQMTPIRKLLMTQLDKPGCPTMMAQFNVDIADFGFYDKKHPEEFLTLLMMQAASQVLEDNEGFRHFLSYNKMHCTKGSYVALIEKLADCGDHLSTICFRNCHELTAAQLLSRIERNQQLMIYCYNKRLQTELEHPQLKRNLDRLFHEEIQDVYPQPLPGSYGVYVSNMGAYGYTQANVPLLRHMGLHLTLLAVERKPVWNPSTNSFENKDYLPISISADSRVFDGLLGIPQLINEAFQKKLKDLNTHVTDTAHSSDYAAIIHDITDSLIAKKNSVRRGKIISHLLNHKILLKNVNRLCADEIAIYSKKLSEHTDYHNLANQLLLDYLGFNAEAAGKDEQFKRCVEKLMNENKEAAYRVLYGLQTVWLDYVDVQESFTQIYEKVANHRLDKLAKFLSKIASF